MITASMSTIGWRAKSLPVAVASILPQVDRLNVFLQDYEQTPDCLNDPRVVVLRDAEEPVSASLGASAKFHWYWFGMVDDGYHFTVDDDIAYPPDYVAYCARKIDEYGRAAVVGFHGAIYQPVMRHYFKDRELWGFQRQCDADRFVHMLGTGTVAMHTGTLRLAREDFAAPSSCDLFLGLVAQRQHVPMLCLERPKNYLNPLATGRDKRSASTSNNYAARMLELHKSIPEWRVYTAQRKQ